MDNQINFIKSAEKPSLTGKLEDLKTTLILVQAACLLAQEGISRLSAGELVERLASSSNIILTPSQVGLILMNLGLKKYITHGKSRFVLDPAQLEDIRLYFAAQCHEQMQSLQSMVEKYKILPAQIQALEDAVTNIQLLESRQRELNQLIAASQPQVAKVNELERRWQSLQREANRVIELEKTCQELATKISELPSLAARRTSLEEGLRAYQNDEKILSEKESQLAAWLGNLQERYVRVDLATLQYNIRLKKQELEQINKQIDGKRSFLDKLLRRHKEGGR